MTKSERMQSFSALIQVTLRRSSVFWDITPCSQSKVNWCFGGTYRFPLQGRTRYQRESRWQAEYWYLARLIRPWRWRRYVPPKLRLTSNGSHGVISENIVLFITTAVRRTSCPTTLRNIAEWIRDWLKVAVELVTLMLCVRQILNSNLNLQTDYSYWVLSWFSSVPPGK
jgi:hypothetical protein